MWTANVISGQDEVQVLRSDTKKIQTHKRFKRTLIFYDIDTQSANFQSNPLRQATKRHLNKSYTVKNDEKWDDVSSVWLSFCSVLGRIWKRHEKSLGETQFTIWRKSQIYCYVTCYELIFEVMWKGTHLAKPGQISSLLERQNFL